MICRRQFWLLLAAFVATVATLVLASNALAANGFWTVQFEQPTGGTIQVDSQVPVMRDVLINPLGLGQLTDYHYIEYVDDTAAGSGELPEQQLTGSCPGTAGLCSAPHNLPDSDTEIDVPYSINSDDVSVSFDRPYLLANHQITVTAVPDPGYYFHGWSGGGCGTQPTCQIAYLQDADISADFSQCPNGASCLTLSNGPAALGSVSVHEGSPTGPLLQPPGNCEPDLCTYQVPAGTQLSLVPAANGNAEIDTWTGCDSTSANGDCTITVNGEDEVHAQFDYPLIINKPAWEVAVWVTVNNQYVGACSATLCKYRLQPGDTVVLQRDVEFASDDGNYNAVLGWSGCTPEASSPDFCDLTMTDAETVVPSYTDSWTVDVDRLPHGEVTSSPAGIDCGDSNDECSHDFPTGSKVTFTATAAPGYTVGGWNQGIPEPSGSGECASGGQSATCTDTLDHSPRPFGASFFPDLTTDVVGSGGVQVSGDEGVPCAATLQGSVAPAAGTGCEAFAPGTAVQVSQTASPGYAFGSFDGCDDVQTGSGNPAVCQLELDAPRTVTTTFNGTYPATVSVTSASYGSVTMSPCSGTCDTTAGGGNFTATYDAATPVTLTETPSSQGTFTGWSGGGCSGTQPTCQTTIGAFLDQGDATHITANYVPASALQVTVIGQGTVTSSPAGISCVGPGTCASSFSNGSSPTLIATPFGGWTFGGWSGGGSTPCSGTGTCSPTITATPGPVTATFLAPAPIATTTASGSPSTTGMTLTGTVDPNGYDSTCHFEWGTTTGYGTDTVPGVVLSATGASPITVSIGGLSPGTTYHYRVVATNAFGTTYGTDQSFTTATVPSTVATGPATAIAAVSATLNGQINPNGYATTYHFEYGFDFDHLTSTGEQPAGAGTTPVAVSAAIGGLNPFDATYVWRLVVTNVFGSYTVDGQSFTTIEQPPTVTSQPATGVTPTTATLNALINPNGTSSQYIVQWGQTTSYGNQTSTPVQIGSGTSDVPVSLPITGLASNTTYHYRIVADSQTLGPTNGPDTTFTTPRFTVDSGQSTFTADGTGSENVADTNTVNLLVTLKATTGAQIPYGGDAVSISSTLGKVSAVTDNGDGTYSATLTTHVAGTATLTATVDGTPLAAQPLVTFQAGSLSGSGSPITVTPGQTVLLGQDSATVTVTASDAAGNPLGLTGLPVQLFTNWGTLSSVTDNGNGTYSATLSASSPGTAAIQGTIGGLQLTLTPVYITDADGGHALWNDPGATPADGHTAATVSVQLRDSSGNALSSSQGPVVFSTSDPGAQISAVTDHNNGSYSATVTSTVAQTVHVSAAFADHPNAPFSAQGSVDFSLPAASASLSTLTGPTHSVADTNKATVDATVADAFGDPIPGATVEFDCVTSGQQCATSTTDASGDATAQIPDLLSGEIGTEPVTAVVHTSGGDVTLDASASVVFVPGPPVASSADVATDAAVSSAPQQLGRPVFVTVTTRDANGTPEAAGGATVTLSSTLGTLSSVVDNGDGTYSASLTSTQAGTATITATINGVVSSHTGVAYFANPPAGAASTFTASTGSAVVGQSVTLSIHAQDANGYPLIGQPISIDCPQGSVSVTTDASGDASTSCTSTTAATVTFNANIANQPLLAAPSVEFLAGPTVPADSRLSFTAPSSPGGAYSLEVDAVDSFGNLTRDGAHDVELHTTLGSFSNSGADSGIQAQAGQQAGSWSASLYPAGANGTAHVTATVDGVAVGQILDIPLSTTLTSTTPTLPSTTPTPPTTTPTAPSTVPSAAAIRRVLSQVLGVHASTRIPAVLKAGGYKVTFPAPGAGKLTVTWYIVVKKKQRTIAATTVRVTRSGKDNVTIRLSKFGRSQLRLSRTIKLTETAAFTPTGGRTTRLSKTFSLKK